MQRPSQPPRSTGRVLALLAIFLAPAALLKAQDLPRDNPEVRGVIRMAQDASRALQAGNAAAFLRFFDRKRFQGYATLESHIVALTTQSDIASSIDVIEIQRIEEGYRLSIDWLVQLSVKETPGPLETRREVLRIEVGEESNGRWRIKALQPVEIFRPQGAAQALGVQPKTGSAANFRRQQPKQPAATLRARRTHLDTSKRRGLQLDRAARRNQHA
jgi:hypothetical protein